MWSRISVPSNVQITDVKLASLLLFYLFLDPFLNSCVIVASFHSEGTIPSLVTSETLF